MNNRNNKFSLRERFVLGVTLILTLIISFRCIQLKIYNEKIIKEIDRRFPVKREIKEYQRGSIFTSAQNNPVCYATNSETFQVSINLDIARYRFASYSYDKAFINCLNFLSTNLGYNLKRLNHFLKDLDKHLIEEKKRINSNILNIEKNITQLNGIISKKQKKISLLVSNKNNDYKKDIKKQITHILALKKNHQRLQDAINQKYFFLNSLVEQRPNQIILISKNATSIIQKFTKFEQTLYQDIYRSHLYYSEKELNWQVIENKVANFQSKASMLKTDKLKPKEIIINFATLKKIVNFHNNFLLKQYIKTVARSIKNQNTSSIFLIGNKLKNEEDNLSINSLKEFLIRNDNEIDENELAIKGSLINKKEILLNRNLLPSYKDFFFNDVNIFAQTIRQRTIDIDKLKLKYKIIRKAITFQKKPYTFNNLGIIIKSKQTRVYPNKKVGNLTGFLQNDTNKPLMGLEKSLDKYLQKKENKNGDNVYLSINSHIQSIAEKIITKYQQEYQCKSINILMANPYNGKIIAMAQYPYFDSNIRSKNAIFKNTIIADQFQPGSVIKPLLIAGGLDRGYLNSNDMIFCENGYWSKYKITDEHPLGNASLRDIIVQSSNIGAAKVALEKNGTKNTYSIYKEIGLGSRLNYLEFPTYEQATGTLRPYTKWVPLDTTRAGYGYSIASTMPQILSAYCAIANGGTQVHLSILEERLTAEGKIKKNPPLKKFNFFKKSTTDYITDALIGVVKEGTARQYAPIQGYKVAGKTGTSSKYNNKDKNIASFIGYVPAYKPAFVIYVVVDEPPYAKRFGSTAAAPIFNEIAKNSLKILNILPYDD